MTVCDILSAYMRHCAVECVHGTTARTNRERVFEWFCILHGNLPVDNLRAYHLTDFVESRPGWVSVSTRRAGANFIKAAFRWAFDDERIERDPFRKVRYAEAERRPDMPDDIFERLCAAASKPFEAVLRFLRLTGARVGEVVTACPADIDLERGIWIVQRHKTRKKTGKPRVVALVPDAVELIKRLATESPVFRNCLGQPWTVASLEMALKRLKKRLGITHPAVLHSIRHRAASAAIAAGAPIKLVSVQLGHSTVQTTEAYYCDVVAEIDAIRGAFALGIRRSGLPFSG